MAFAGTTQIEKTGNMIQVTGIGFDADNEEIVIDLQRFIGNGAVAEHANLQIVRTAGTTNTGSVSIQGSQNNTNFSTIKNFTTLNTSGIEPTLIDYTSATATLGFVFRHLKLIVITVGSGNTLTVIATVKGA